MKPPTRCICGHKRINHPGGEACRLCPCKGFVAEKLPRRTVPLDVHQLDAIGRPIPTVTETQARQERIRGLGRGELTNREIAEVVGCCIKTVERVLRKVAA